MAFASVTRATGEGAAEPSSCGVDSHGT